MTLDDECKAADPDRWLSSRLVGAPDLRRALVGLYLVDHELSKVARSVRDPLMGDIRLAWWREALETAAGEGAGRHPAIAALSAAVASGRIDAEALAGLAEARRGELDPDPFADEPALAAHLDATEGRLLTLALRLLSPSLETEPLRPAGVAWGWLSTRLRPVSWADAEEPEISAHRRHRAAELLDGVRPALNALPAEAFPAIAHLALVRAYARGRAPSELGKRWRMLTASLTGRV